MVRVSYLGLPDILARRKDELTRSTECIGSLRKSVAVLLRCKYRSCSALVGGIIPLRLPVLPRAAIC